MNKKKCAIYICDRCQFQEEITLEHLKKRHVFNETDLSTYPQFECHGCHRDTITVKRIEELPASWFPDITPEEFYADF